MRTCHADLLEAAFAIMKRKHAEDPSNPYTAERLREIVDSLLPMNNLDTRDLYPYPANFADPPFRYFEDKDPGKLCKWG